MYLAAELSFCIYKCDQKVYDCVCVCVGEKGSGGGRGRRRLEFKRFQGKTMFLDLPGYRHVARLEQELTSRGAVSGVCE